MMPNDWSILAVGHLQLSACVHCAITVHENTTQQINTAKGLPDQLHTFIHGPDDRQRYFAAEDQFICLLVSAACCAGSVCAQGYCRTPAATVQAVRPA
jgi:hypothetical protein